MRGAQRAKAKPAAGNVNGTGIGNHVAKIGNRLFAAIREEGLTALI
jgi:hypothetical protein